MFPKGPRHFETGITLPDGGIFVRTSKTKRLGNTILGDDKGRNPIVYDGLKKPGEIFNT